MRGSRSRLALGRARTGQRKLGDEPRRCCGQLPTARSQGLATRRTQSNLGGAAFAAGHPHHLPRLVAATIWGRTGTCPAFSSSHTVSMVTVISIVSHFPDSCLKTKPEQGRKALELVKSVSEVYAVIEQTPFRVAPDIGVNDVGVPDVGSFLYQVASVSLSHEV